MRGESEVEVKGEGEDSRVRMKVSVRVTVSRVKAKKPTRRISQRSAIQQTADPKLLQQKSRADIVRRGFFFVEAEA